jgi:hypothetical protein
LSGDFEPSGVALFQGGYRSEPGVCSRREAGSAIVANGKARLLVVLIGLVVSQSDDVWLPQTKSRLQSEKSG